VIDRSDFDAILRWASPLARAYMLAQLGEKEAKPKRRSKYGAQRTQVDGVWFDSKREARRYIALKMFHKAGNVAWFCLQPRFILPGPVEYRADFLVKWLSGRVTVEDAKGVRTKTYRLKKRQVQAIYGVEIKEV
jgi:hypothetical protein